jgi:hypothetical protein
MDKNRYVSQSCSSSSSICWPANVLKLPRYHSTLLSVVHCVSVSPLKEENLVHKNGKDGNPSCRRTIQLWQLLWEMIVLPKAIALKHDFVTQGCLWTSLCCSKEICFGKWLCCHVECWATFHFLVTLFLGEFVFHLKFTNHSNYTSKFKINNW